MSVAGRRRRRSALSFALCVLGGGLVAHGQWTHPHYVVQLEDPWKLEKQKHADACAAQQLVPCPKFKLPAGATLPPLKFLATSGTPVTQKAGQYLTEIAGVFAQQGLTEPNIEPEVATDAGATRWAFMHPLDGNLGAYSDGDCNDPPVAVSWLSLDQRPWTDSKLFGTSAHELFHAVQYRYPALAASGKRRCEGTFVWFDEGTADAVSSFLLERRGAKLETGQDLGLRPYDASLHFDNSWLDEGVTGRVFEVFGFDLLTTCADVEPPDTTDKCIARAEEKARELMGYLTSSFWRFLMDRYDPALDSMNPERLHALSKVFLEKPGPSQNLTLDWVAKHARHWGPFQHAYAEFAVEFASWPAAKYAYEDDFEKWLDLGFGGCQSVELTSGGKRSKKIDLIAPLHPVSAQCFQVTLKGFQGKEIMLEAVAEAETTELADQLVLGIAREERGDEEHYDCYSHAQGSPQPAPGEFRCLLYGKTQKVIGPGGEKNVRTWRFDEPRLAEEESARTTFVLSNVHPETASSTEKIEQLEITFAVSTADGSTTKAPGLGVPEGTSLGSLLPNLVIPQRQLLYGIKKKGPIETGYSLGMASIQFEALGAAGGVIDTYTLAPVEPVRFGQTGPLEAMVMQGGFGAQAPTPGLATRSSHYCAANQEVLSIGRITRSDDELLQISIDTPICELNPMNLEQCQNGCPMVDHVKADLTLAIGWRHFAEFEVEDLVTPAVRLDIDRYHHEVAGEPLPDWSGGGGGDGGSGAEDGGAGGDGGGNGTDGDACLCTCEELEWIKQKRDEVQETGVLDPAFMQKAMRCGFECAQGYRACRR